MLIGTAIQKNLEHIFYKPIKLYQSNKHESTVFLVAQQS